MSPDAAGWCNEPDALQRVAALLARGAGIDEILAATAAEAGTLSGAERAAVTRYDGDTEVTALAVWPPGAGDGARWAPGEDDVWTEIRRSGRPAHGDCRARDGPLGGGAVAGCPLIAGQGVWGVLSVHAAAPFPAGTEERLRGLAGLAAGAVVTSRTREYVLRLAAEHAALRRVATLVAAGAPPTEVFDAVVEGLGRLLGVGSTALVRYDGSGHAIVLAGWGRVGEAVPLGTRLPLGGDNVISRVARTRTTVRMDYRSDGPTGEIATQARRLNTRRAVGEPVFMGGQLWGAMVAAALGDESIPDETALRLEHFTTLVGAAIANSDARLELARLADEQAALRRVATLVAEETPPADLFARVAEEAAAVLPGEVEAAIHRYDPDDTATVVATYGSPPPHGISLGERIPLGGTSAIARVFRERRPVRIDYYPGAEGTIAERAQRHGIRSAFGSPIVVRGRLWGVMIAATHDENLFPADIERQVRAFTDLIATSIANAQARDDRQRLADEQAALRRVATLVAAAAAPPVLFAAVVEEVRRLLGAAQVGLLRVEEGAEEVTIVAMRGRQAEHVATGSRMPLDGDSATAAVVRTGRSARRASHEVEGGAIAELARRTNVQVAIAAPIIVEGAVWGVITASWEGRDLPPDDAEERLAEFAELIDTAIVNAHSRDQLEASRARVLTTADETRRRVVRDLHDGAQQRLVHTIVTLKLAHRAFDADPERAKTLAADALAHAERANTELRALAHGILPAVLTRGLAAGVDGLVERAHLPVTVNITETRVAPEIEANAYFIVAEALTNVVKHAQATHAEISAVVRDGTLVVEIVDDGVGGGDPTGGGLLGIADRAAALGGRLRLESPAGAGTRVIAELPLR
jgi:signal transduction histidine kinase